MSTDKASPEAEKAIAATLEAFLSAGDLEGNFRYAHHCAQAGDFEGVAQQLQWAEDNMRDAKRHLTAAIAAIDSARAAIAKAEQL